VVLSREFAVEMEAMFPGTLRIPGDSNGKNGKEALVAQSQDGSDLSPLAVA